MEADRKLIEPKQVIVARRDLNMSPGKLAAQVAHASLGVITEMLEWQDSEPVRVPVPGSEFDKKVVFRYGDLCIVKDGAIDKWLSQRFTKVVLEVNSEMELLAIYQQADEAKLPCKLILDSGFTEFGGVPTYTCVAIGPDFPEAINKVTGKLKLYGN